MGTGYRFILSVSRSPLERLFVLATSLVVLVVASLCAFRLHRDPQQIGTIQDLLGVAGLLVGLASFRDIIRVSAAPQFTALEFVVLGIPIAALGIGFVRAWIVRDKPTSPTL